MFVLNKNIGLNKLLSGAFCPSNHIQDNTGTSKESETDSPLSSPLFSRILITSWSSLAGQETKLSKDACMQKVF